MTTHAIPRRARPPGRGFSELVKVETKLALRVPDSMPHTFWDRNPRARQQKVRTDGAVNNDANPGEQARQRGGDRERHIRQHRPESGPAALP